MGNVPLTLPAPGGDSGSWGDKLNAALTAISGDYLSAADASGLFTLSTAQPVNAMHGFGVVADGTTDDTAALQAWIDGLSGRPGYLPAGAYAVTQLTVPSDTTLRLDSRARVIRTGNSATGRQYATVVNADQTGGNSDIAIIGGRFESATGQNGGHFGLVNVTGLTVAGFVVGSYSGDWCFRLRDCHDVTVDRARISGSQNAAGEDGMDCRGGSNVTITNCIIHAGDDMLVIATDATSLAADGYTISNVVGSSATANLLRVYNEGGVGGTVSNVTVSNVVGSCGAHAVVVQDSTGARGVTKVAISNMLVDATAGSGQAVYAVSCADVSFTAVQVHGCATENFYADDAANVTFTGCAGAGSSTAGASVFAAEAVTGVAYIGCAAAGSAASGFRLGNSASSKQTVGARVSGCTSTGNAEHGILLADATGAVMVGCTATGNTGAGVDETAPSDSNVIVGCDLRDNGSSINLVGPASMKLANQGAANDSLHAQLNLSGTLAHTGSQVGFNGVAPVVKAANPGTATGTDAAVINAVVTALRNVGLVT